MTALSLLSFLILIIMTANVPVAYGESGMKIVLPSGKTITPSAAAPPASAKGFSAPGASLLSSSDGDPVDTTVGPTTRINQPVFEGDCTTPGGCTQNTPSIAKSNKNAVIGYQSTWGFYQPTPTHVGLYAYSQDGAKTWPNDGSLLLSTANPDQILGPPHVVSDRDGNFWYAAEFATLSGGYLPGPLGGRCGIAVGRSRYFSSLLVWDPPALAIDSAPFIFPIDIFLVGAKFLRPRIAADPTSGNIYLTYVAVNDSSFQGCGSTEEPGDFGVESRIYVQAYDVTLDAWGAPGLVSNISTDPNTISANFLGFFGPAYVDGPDIAIDASPSTYPSVLPNYVFIAWEQYDGALNLSPPPPPPSPSYVYWPHTIQGNEVTTSFPFAIKDSVPVGPVNRVNPPPGYSGMTVFDFSTPTLFNWIPGLRSFPTVATNPQKSGEWYVTWNSAFEETGGVQDFDTPGLFPDLGYSVDPVVVPPLPPFGGALSDQWQRNDDKGFANFTGGTGYAAMATSLVINNVTGLVSPTFILFGLPDPTKILLTFRSFLNDPSLGILPGFGYYYLSVDGGPWFPFLPLFVQFLNTTRKDTVTIDLTVFKGSSVQMAWVFAGNSFGQFWQVDDINVTFVFGGDSEVLFAKTVDAGSSWFTPTRVNDNPIGDGTAQFMPAIAVRTDDGLIKIAYYDQRDYLTNPDFNAPTDVFVAESRDRGLTFEPNVKVTKTPMEWMPIMGVNQESDRDPNFGLRIGATMDADHIYVAWSGPPAEGFYGPDIYTAYAENIARISTGDLNFGDLCPGNTERLDVEIFNTGTADLVISKIDFATGTNFSLDPSTPAFPVTISPGSHITITIAASVGPTDVGLITDTLRIYSNDPNSAPAPEPDGTYLLELKIALNALTPTWTVSATTLDFGGVPVDDTLNPGNYSKLLPLVVTNTSGCPVVIQSAAFLPTGDFTTTTPFPITLTVGSNARIDIVFNPTAGGALPSTFTLTATAPASPLTTPVALTGTGLVAVLQTASTMDFGGVPVDDTLNPTNYFKDLVHTVNNEGGAVLQITALTFGTGTDYSLLAPTLLPINIQPGTSYDLKVRFNPTASLTRADTLQIVSNGGTLTVNLTGQGLVPVLQTASLMDFGGVPWEDALNPTNYFKDLVHTVTNTGGAVLQITGIVPTGDYSLLDPSALPITLTPGTSYDVKVRFNPSAAGTSTGTLSITSNGGSATVNLTGVGLVAVLQTASLMDFGGVPWEDLLNPTNYFKDLVHTVNNEGGAVLQITGLTFGTGTDYSLLAPTLLPINIQPGTSYDLKVRFNPTASLTRADTLQIASNGGTVTINLTGQGLVPVLQTNASMDFGGVPWEDALNPTNYFKDLVHTVTNTGGAVLQITAIVPTGDYSLLDPSVLPITLAPGTSYDVKVRFNPSAASPPARTGTLSFTSNGGSPTVSLTGVGLVAALQTDATMDFGGVPWEDALNPTNYFKDLVHTVTNTGGAVLQITAIVPTGDYSLLDPSVLPITLLPGTSYDVKVRFNPSAASPPARTGTLSFTSNGGSPTVSLTGVGLAAALQTDGTKDFGGVPWEDVLNPTNYFKDLVHTVTNTGGAVLQITAIVPTGDYSLLDPAVFPITLTPGTSYDVKVRFNPSAAGTRTGTLSFTSNGGSPTVSLTGVGLVAVLQTASTMDFGGVPVDDATNPSFFFKDLVHTVTNIGGAILQITAITPTGDFTLLDPSALPITLLPGTSYDIKVRFNPSAAGTRTGTLAIASNGGSALINLTGIGLVPTITLELPGFGGVPVDNAANPGNTYADRTLKIHNTGQANLQLTNIQSSDAQFTFPALPSFTPPINLAPNDFLNVTVRFDPSACGNQSSPITVTTSPALSSGNVISATGVGLEPKITLDLPSFESVPADDATNPGNFTRDSTLKIMNNGQGNLSVSSISITPNNPGDTWTITSPVVYPLLIPPGSFQNVTIRFNPANNASGGRTATVNVFNNTDCPVNSPAQITASGFAFVGVVNLELQTNGGVPWDDLANPGNSYSDRTLRIHNTGTANIVVTDISAVGGDYLNFTFPNPVLSPVTISPDSQFDVTVRFNPSSAGSKQTAIVVTFDPFAQTTQIAATGYGLDPNIYVELPDFGTVPWDDQANDFNHVDRILNIHNTGTANLILQSVTPACPASGTPPVFCVVNGPVDGTSVSPDATLPVTIRFNPTAPGPVAGTLTIRYYTDFTLAFTTSTTITGTGVGLTPNIYLQLNDFGAVGIDDLTNPIYVNDQVLMIHNTGDANLVIKSVVGCGDFTVVNGPIDGTIVSPDANLPVTIEFNPSLPAGVKSCAITVTYYTDYFGNGTGTTATATITAHGIGLVPSISLELPGFGGVPVDDVANPGNFTADRILKIHNTGQANLQITAIVSSNSAEFVISPETTLVFPINIAPNDDFNVTVRFNPNTCNQPAGPNRFSTITVTSSPVLIGNTVVANGVGLEPIIRLDLPSFGSVPADDPTNPGNNTRDSVLKIHNNGQAVLSVSGITFTGVMDADSWTIVDTLTYPLLIPPGSFQNVTIRFNPDNTKSGGRTATVNVANNTLNNCVNPVNSPALVTASGFAYAEDINLEIESHGPVAWDDNANPGKNYVDKVLRIDNTGEANLVVTAITTVGGNASDFTILLNPGDIPLTVSPDSFVNVTVRFNPSAAGARTTNIQVTYDPFAKIATVAATGYGLDPAIYLELMDFGTVPWDDEANAFHYVDRILSIHNTGSANLIIKSVVATGDFSVIGGPADGTSVSPDATFPVTIRFNPSVAGQISGAVTVTYYTNFTVGTTTTSQIIATGIGLGILPPYLEIPFFGGVPVDDATNPVFYMDKELQIHNKGDANLILKSVIGAGDFFVINGPADGTKLSPNSTFPVTIRFNPSQGGLRTGTITVTYYTDLQVVTPPSGTTAFVTIDATGIGLVPGIYTTLDDFGGVPVEDAPINGFYFSYFVDRELRIHNTGDANIWVTSITVAGANPADFAIVNPPPYPVVIGPGKALGNIAVRFNPTAGGNRTATINVIFNPGIGSPATNTYSIAATGVGLVPVLDVTGPIDFGALPVVDTLGTECGPYEKEEVIYIFNKGQAILNVTSVTCAAGDCTDFTVLSPVTFPENVQPGQTIMVRIHFNPTQAGTRSATIRVTSGEANTTDPPYAGRNYVDIPVQGIGLIGDPVLTPVPVIYDPTVVGFDDKCGEEKVITLYNKGPACLRVDTIQIIDDETGSYTIVEAPTTPFILSAGEGIPIKIRFNPTLVQRKIEAKVEVTTDLGEVSIKTITANLCGEGVNTGFRVLVFDKFGKLLTGSSKTDLQNGYISKIQVASKGIKPGVSQTFTAPDLSLKEIDGCLEGEDDIKFHLEYQLPPTYTVAAGKASFKVTVTYFTSTWKNPYTLKFQKMTFTMQLPECNGFQIFKIQAVK